MAQQRRKVTEEHKAQIQGLWNAGLSRQSIANTLGFSVNTVRDVIKRLQKQGVIPKRHEAMQLSDEDIQSLAQEAKVSVEVVRHLLTLARKERKNVPMRAVVGSYLALWTSQQGRCYYTGATLTVDGSPRSAELVQTGGIGKVFVSKIARKFRGNMSHQSFLRIVGAVARYSLKHKV